MTYACELGAATNSVSHFGQLRHRNKVTLAFSKPRHVGREGEAISQTRRDSEEAFRTRRDETKALGEHGWPMAKQAPPLPAPNARPYDCSNSHPCRTRIRVKYGLPGLQKDVWFRSKCTKEASNTTLSVSLAKYVDFTASDRSLHDNTAGAAIFNSAAGVALYRCI